jgi:hypothetical protein
LTLETNLDYTFSITAKIEITKNEERHQNIFLILVESLEGVKQSPSATLAVHRRVLLARREVAGIVEQVDVDEVKCGAAEDPPRPEESLPAPFALGEELLGEFGFLLSGNRLNVARVDRLVIDRLELVCQEIPYFDIRYGIMNEVQVAECLEQSRAHINPIRIALARVMQFLMVGTLICDVMELIIKIFSCDPRSLSRAHIIR